MSDDLYDQYGRAAADAAGREAFYRGLAVGRAQGYQQGCTDGSETGRAVGFVEGVNSVKGALSDGLRHGSPVCGQALESLKRLGAIATDDPVNAPNGE